MTRRCDCSASAVLTPSPFATSLRRLVFRRLWCAPLRVQGGLREAVDEHVARVFEAMLAEIIEPANAEPFDQQTVPILAEMVAANLPAGSAIPAYLGRCW